MVWVRPEDYASDNASGDNQSQSSYSIKTPKRVISCSDGDLEEYSTDEEVETTNEPTVDPAQLTWVPWIMFQTGQAATKALTTVENMGESLAWFFGITSPRFYFELQEHYRREKMALNEAEKQKGWVEDTNSGNSVQTQEPAIDRNIPDIAPV